MKLAATILLLTVCAAGYADGPSPESNLYDRLLKITFKPGQSYTLVLGGKEYPFGPFNDKPLLSVVAADPEAQKLFQKSAEEQRTFTYNLYGVLGLMATGAGAEYYAGTLPKSSGSSKVWGWTGLGLVVGGFIWDVALSSNVASAEDAFYKGVNQYNHDVLSKQP